MLPLLPQFLVWQGEFSQVTHPSTAYSRKCHLVGWHFFWLVGDSVSRVLPDQIQQFLEGFFELLESGLQQFFANGLQVDAEGGNGGELCLGGA